VVHHRKIAVDRPMIGVAMPPSRVVKSTSNAPQRMAIGTPVPMPARKIRRPVSSSDRARQFPFAIGRRYTALITR
jgi:hypothetical protein